MFTPIIIGYNTPVTWFLILSFPLGLLVIAIGIFFDRKHNPIPASYKPSNLSKTVKYFFIGAISLILISFMLFLLTT